MIKCAKNIVKYQIHDNFLTKKKNEKEQKIFYAQHRIGPDEIRTRDLLFTRQAL